jgi:hypothetical protein
MGRSALLRRRLAVILAGWFDGGDAPFDHEQAEAAFNPVTISFTLDGAALATTRRPIKPFHDPPPAFGFERAWHVQQGKIMSPDDLSVGQIHQPHIRPGRNRRDHVLHRRGQDLRLPGRLAAAQRSTTQLRVVIRKNPPSSERHVWRPASTNRQRHNERSARARPGRLGRHRWARGSLQALLPQGLGRHQPLHHRLGRPAGEQAGGGRHPTTGSCQGPAMVRWPCVRQLEAP